MYPENWAAVDLFIKLSTQWNCGYNGRTGLNYLVVLEMIDRMELNKNDAENMFNDIQHLERAALTEMSKE